MRVCVLHGSARFSLERQQRDRFVARALSCELCEEASFFRKIKNPKKDRKSSPFFLKTDRIEIGLHLGLLSKSNRHDPKLPLSSRQLLGDATTDEITGHHSQECSVISNVSHAHYQRREIGSVAKSREINKEQEACSKRGVEKTKRTLTSSCQLCWNQPKAFLRTHSSFLHGVRMIPILCLLWFLSPDCQLLSITVAHLVST